MQFEQVAQEFLTRVGEIVWCTVATVDTHGNPRTRILHPIWQYEDGKLFAWVGSGKTPVKAAHLERNPNVSCLYWGGDMNPITVEARASWVEESKHEWVWNLLKSTPEPLGYDPVIAGWSSPDDPSFEPLRLDAWRVTMLPTAVLETGDRTQQMFRF